MTNKPLPDQRINYQVGALNRDDMHPDPLKLFAEWLEFATNADIKEPNAMTLATADADGNPNARMVLLKGFDENGFVFYTNHDSTKGQELADNRHAALVFWWNTLERQVRIQGGVIKMTAEESMPYYSSRPRGSRIGAWTSPQSQPITGRSVLEYRQKGFEEKFADQTDIPIPPYWGGYRVVPHTIEFWQGRPSRLHDRFRYKFADGEWKMERLAP